MRSHTILINHDLVKRFKSDCKLISHIADNNPQLDPDLLERFRRIYNIVNNFEINEELLRLDGDHKVEEEAKPEPKTELESKSEQESKRIYLVAGAGLDFDVSRGVALTRRRRGRDA